MKSRMVLFPVKASHSKKGGKIKVGIITIIYVGDEGGLKPTNISGKHDITSV